MKKHGDLLRMIAKEAGFKSAMHLADTMEVSRTTVNEDFKRVEIKDTVLEKYYSILNINYNDFIRRYNEIEDNNLEDEWKNIAKEYKSLYESVKQENVILRETVTKYKPENQ